MSKEALEQAVMQSLEKLFTGDIDGFMDYWSDDVVWRVSGDNPMSGVYRGRDECRAAAIGFMELGGPSFRLEPVDILSDDRHAAVMFHTTGVHAGTSLDVISATFFTVDDEGKWNISWWLPSDQQAYDDFFRTGASSPT